MKNPLISVIIPIYNVEKYLRKCIDSVLAQTYTKLEIILVDDGSLDNCGKICDEYAEKDERVKVIHKKNGGLSSARNYGLEVARGEYISFIDSDDWVAPTFIEILLKTLQEQQVKISAVGYFFVGPAKIKRESISPNKQKKQIISSQRAVQLGFESLGFFAVNKLYARELFAGISFPQGQLYEDIATIYKVFLKTDKIALYDEPLYYYNHFNMTSITKNKFSVKKLDYFKSCAEVLSYAQKVRDKGLIYIIQRERAYHIAGFFRQMIEANFKDNTVIVPMHKELRRNIGKLLLSRHKLSNKLFALTCCANFNLAAKIYRILSD